MELGGIFLLRWVIILRYSLVTLLQYEGKLKAFKKLEFFSHPTKMLT